MKPEQSDTPRTRAVSVEIGRLIAHHQFGDTTLIQHAELVQKQMDKVSEIERELNEAKVALEVSNGMAKNNCDAAMNLINQLEDEMDKGTNAINVVVELGLEVDRLNKQLTTLRAVADGFESEAESQGCAANCKCGSKMCEAVAAYEQFKKDNNEIL